MFNIRWKVLTSFCFLMIVENSVYWIRELIAHCQRKYQHNSYSDSNGPLCEDLQDPQQHSCKKLEYIRTSQLFIAGGGGKRRIWGRSQGFPGKRRGDQHKGGRGVQEEYHRALWEDQVNFSKILQSLSFTPPPHPPSDKWGSVHESELDRKNWINKTLKIKKD